MTSRVARVAAALLFLIALCADALAPAAYDQQFRDDANAAASRRHPLGTDELGRDRLSRLLHGARVSLLLAPAAALLATLLAAMVGCIAGWNGGWADRILMSSTDLMISVPWIFLLITVRAMLPLNTPPLASVVVTFALLGCLGWAGPARVIRASVQTLRSSDFLLHARASGCATIRLLAIHVLPSAARLMRTQFWIAVPAFILAEANLSLLGLGVAEPLPSLGSLLKELESFGAVQSNPFLLAPLALLLLLTICCRLAFERPEELEHS